MNATLVQFTKDQADILVESRASHDANTRKLAACESDYIRQGINLYLSDDKNKSRTAEALLVYYWQERVKTDGKDAPIRALFSQVSKEYHDLTDGRAIKVEDNKLTLAAKRNTKKHPLKEAVKEIDGSLSDEQREKLAAMLLNAAASMVGGE